MVAISPRRAAGDHGSAACGCRWRWLRGLPALVAVLATAGGCGPSQPPSEPSAVVVNLARDDSSRPDEAAAEMDDAEIDEAEGATREADIVVATRNAAKPSKPPPPPSPQQAKIQQARNMFRQGVELLQQGDYQRAYQVFVDTYQLVPNPNVLYNIAVAAEKAGRTADACQYYARYLKEAPPGGHGSRDAAKRYSQLCGAAPTP